MFMGYYILIILEVHNLNAKLEGYYRLFIFLIISKANLDEDKKSYSTFFHISIKSDNLDIDL